MKFTSAHRLTLRAILDQTYTPLDVREFVQLCYALAVPLIRSKIHHGKLNLESLGLDEADVVCDCVADLFKRDRTGSFIQVKAFFNNLTLNLEICRDEEVVVALRKLIFIKVHNAIVRLHSEADPTLGKILRNVMLELDRRSLFDYQARFGEMYLVVLGENPAFHLPPLPVDFLRQRFSQVVSVRDSIPMMVEKLYRVLLEQDEFQRAVPIVMASLVFKEAYAIGSDMEATEDCVTDRQTEQNDVQRIAELVCRRVASDSKKSYVAKGKRSSKEFDDYMRVVKEILLGEFGTGGTDGNSYYEKLQKVMPGLTRGVYGKRHRAVLEYLAKKAKKDMKQELKNA